MQNVLLIWDLDGTLIDSAADVFNSLEKAVNSEGLSKADQISDFRLGPTIDKILDISFPKEKMPEEKKKAIIRNFRNTYDNCSFDNTVLFDGLESILRDNSYEHHILTNKPDVVTKRILVKLGLIDCFKSIITPYSFMKDLSDKKLSKIELFKYMKDKYHDKFLVGIGDMATDCTAAKASGIATIGVLWGTGSKEELEQAGCDVIISSPVELQIVLKNKRDF